ncbi:nucleoside hydrolase [Coraliomargarita parva]|uniref:nucleoside hydrolase n=1 Tax=Coraliomargarita parva TaxID=3014050 RepID=UPI0022B3B8D0|nr:nucleoside hydrolase [Coraliomargarita parva]
MLKIIPTILSAGSLLAVCALLSTSGHAAESAKRKILIDDDSFSLMHMLLLGSEDVEVVGITSVTGNSWANRVTAYELRGLELVGRTDIPVAEGATHPLLNTERQTEIWEQLYGKLTWKGAWMKEWVEDTIQETPTYYGPNDPIDDLPWGAPTTQPIDTIAANFMIEMVRKYPGEITIIEGGPFTNVALAQRLDPEFASLAKELIYMGGSFNPHQTLDNEVAAQFAREFVNSPRREFNIRLDPEAASIASRAPWKKITVIPVDPSTGTQLTAELINKLADVAPPAMAAVMRNWEPGFPLWDEIAGAIWLDPSLIEEQDTLYVDYNTKFGPGYGDTLSWNEGYQPGLGEQPAVVIRSVNREGLEALLLQNLAQLNKN